ncbi:hypothetical protein ACIRPT_09770 [Streptomyces sp. NPDC101227]|uniref:hypothetical protein n=1 Tax=Streptomyces sp. NPDC101227 TaxID=3366136 RepID=UPI0038299608
MTNTRRTLACLALATVFLGPLTAQAVADPKDDTPIQPHIRMPLSGLLADRGAMPVDWRLFGVPL